MITLQKLKVWLILHSEKRALPVLSVVPICLILEKKEVLYGKESVLSEHIKDFCMCVRKCGYRKAGRHGDISGLGTFWVLRNPLLLLYNVAHALQSKATGAERDSRIKLVHWLSYGESWNELIEFSSSQISSDWKWIEPVHNLFLTLSPLIHVSSGTEESHYVGMNMRFK